MSTLGEKIAEKRKNLGMTQLEVAARMSVTRQTVSRWEAGKVLPDIEKIADIAEILEVSCDYLLKKENTDTEDYTATKEPAVSNTALPGRLLESAKGKIVRLDFFDGEYDVDFFNKDCRILDFEGNWMKIEAWNKKERIEKMIPVSSILSIQFREEEKE